MTAIRQDNSEALHVPNGVAAAERGSHTSLHHIDRSVLQIAQCLQYWLSSIGGTYIFCSGFPVS